MSNSNPELRIVRLSFSKRLNNQASHANFYENDRKHSFGVLGFYDFVTITSRRDLLLFSPADNSGSEALEEHVAPRYKLSQLFDQKAKSKITPMGLDRRLLQGVTTSTEFDSVFSPDCKKWYLSVTQIRLTDCFAHENFLAFVRTLLRSEGKNAISQNDERPEVRICFIAGFDAADLIVLLRAENISTLFRINDEILSLSQETKTFSGQGSDPRVLIEQSLTTLCFWSDEDDLKLPDLKQTNNIDRNLMVRFRGKILSRPEDRDPRLKLQTAFHNEKEIRYAKSFGHYDFSITTSFEKYHTVHEIIKDVDPYGELFALSTTLDHTYETESEFQEGGNIHINEIQNLAEKNVASSEYSFLLTPIEISEKIEQRYAFSDRLSAQLNEVKQLSEDLRNEVFGRLNGSLSRELGIMIHEFENYREAGLIPGTRHLRYAADTLLKLWLELLKDVAEYHRCLDGIEVEGQDGLPPDSLYNHNNLIEFSLLLRRELEKRSAASLQSHARFSRGGYTANVKLVAAIESITSSYARAMKAYHCLKDFTLCNFIMIENVSSSDFQVYYQHKHDKLTITRIKRRMIENFSVGLYQAIHETIQALIQYMLDTISYTSRIFTDFSIDYVALASSKLALGKDFDREQEGDEFLQARPMAAKIITESIDVDDVFVRGLMREFWEAEDFSTKSEQEGKWNLAVKKLNETLESTWDSSKNGVITDSELQRLQEETYVFGNTSMNVVLNDDPNFDLRQDSASQNLVDAVAKQFDCLPFKDIQQVLKRDFPEIISAIHLKRSLQLDPTSINASKRSYFPASYLTKEGTQIKYDNRDHELLEVATCSGFMHIFDKEEDHNRVMHNVICVFFDYHLLAENREQPAEVIRNLRRWIVALTGFLLRKNDIFPQRMDYNESLHDLIRKEFLRVYGEFKDVWLNIYNLETVKKRWKGLSSLDSVFEVIFSQESNVEQLYEDSLTTLQVVFFVRLYRLRIDSLDPEKGEELEDIQRRLQAIYNHSYSYQKDSEKRAMHQHKFFDEVFGAYSDLYTRQIN